MRVRSTQAGVAGDAGWQCVYPMLMSPDPTGLVLRSDTDVLARALRSREIRRVAARPAITRDASCMALCTAVDNCELAPPFMPIGRNEDGLFGAMMAVTDTRALFGHVPIGIVHDSSRPSARLPDDLPSAREARFADLAMAVVEIASGLPPPESVAHGLRRLSQIARDIASLPDAEFVEFLTQVILNAKGRTIARLEDMLAVPASDSWRAAAERYRDALLTTVVTPDLCRLVEFSALPVHDAARACATTLLEWAEILGAWDQIWQHARDHSEDLFTASSRTSLNPEACQSPMAAYARR